MNKPEKRIVEFIKEHHVLTLATSKNNEPYCANCFYAYLDDENAFVFTSDTNTKHMQDVLEQPLVAGSVVLETKTVGKIQGIQFTGLLSEPNDILHKKAKKVYLKRFPYAALMKTTLWILELNFIKMTDNRLGFGKKLIWKKDAGAQ
ncbi:MAG: pyridoxamine 5'-phosphate oxidase family protein [Bacteroidales bacterium]|nr:pyridoxamine 5'-phosphate oxidase family protein [Bacteroidales bacterium]